jgi:hypothetical protein
MLRVRCDEGTKGKTMQFDVIPWRAVKDDGVGFCGVEAGRVVEFRVQAEAIELFLGRTLDRSDERDMKTAFEEASASIYHVAGHCLLTAVPMVISAEMARQEMARRVASRRGN